MYLSVESVFWNLLQMSYLKIHRNLLISVMSIMRGFVLLAAVHKICLCNDFSPWKVLCSCQRLLLRNASYFWHKLQLLNCFSFIGKNACLRKMCAILNGLKWYICLNRLLGNCLVFKVLLNNVKLLTHLYTRPKKERNKNILCTSFPSRHSVDGTVHFSLTACSLFSQEKI